MARSEDSLAKVCGTMDRGTATCEPAPTSANEANLRVCAVFEALADPIVLHHAVTQRVAAANPAAQQLFGPLPEDRTIDLATFVGDPDVAAHFASLDPYGEPAADGFETTVRRTDGHELRVAFRSSRMVYGGEDAWISVVHDVTALRRAQERAARAEALALEIAQKKSSYVASISHELRTPLNGILGMSSLLLESPLGPDQRECADTIHSAAETLLVLLNEILDLAKIEAGRLEVKQAPFSPQQVCADTLRLLRGRAEEQGLSLILETPTPLPALCRGDGLRLHQILLNLVGNAVKFTPEGRVTLRLQQTGAERGRARLRFEVEDTGIGMAPDLLPTIFEPFSQAHGSSGSAYGGTGLGLTISQRLLGLMDAQLDVRSALGAGTTFWFDLVLEDLDGETERSMESERGDVLYVGAHGTTRDQYVGALVQRGFAVEACDLSATALDRVRTRASSGAPFRAVFVERQLPDLDGETLGRSVRNRLRIASLPLYLVTTPDRPVELQRAARSGFGAVLADPDDLVVLDELAGNSPPAAAAPAAAALAQSPTPIPAAPDDAAPSATVESAAPVVLVVEDNPVNQKVVCHMLRKMGFGVELAEDGQQGVDRLRGGNFDLVLMDCQMPVMDGYEATRTIRSLPDGRARIPVVALTANAMEGDREKCLGAGMDDYLSKPAKAEHLRAMLQKWIPQCAERLAAGE